MRQSPRMELWRNTRLYPADRRMMSVAILVSYKLGNTRIGSRKSRSGEVVRHRHLCVYGQGSWAGNDIYSPTMSDLFCFSLSFSTIFSVPSVYLPNFNIIQQFSSLEINLPHPLLNMKLSTITATLALLTTSALAAPTARQFEAQITFHGATPEDTFTQSVPTDSTVFYICKPPSSIPSLLLHSLPLIFYLSPSITSPHPPPVPPHLAISLETSQERLKANIPSDDRSSITSISSAGGATCTFRGNDGSETTVIGAQTVDVGPPQVQLTGSCSAF